MQNLKVISNFVSKVDGTLDSFSERFPYVQIIREQDFFFECDAYDVIIPCFSSQESELSALERAVLKMFQLHPEYSHQDVAEILCLKSETGDASLVRMIHDRLVVLGMIETNHQLTSKGREQLSGKHSIQEENNKIATVFCIRQLNHYLLPLIYMGEIESEDNELSGKNTLTMEIGSTGKRQKITGTLYRIPKKLQAIKPIAPRKHDIEDIINQFNRLGRNTLHRTMIRYNPEYAMTISPSPSRVVLHMKAVLQEGNITYPLISDGVSCDIMGLSEYLSNETNLIQDLMEKSVSLSDVEETSVSSAEIPQKYPQLHFALYGTIQKGDGSLDSEEFADSSEKKYLLHHYFAMEWALHYHLLCNPVPDFIMKLISQQSKTENYRLALKSAENMGLFPPENETILSGLGNVEMQSWEEKRIPSLKTLLPLALIGADTNQEDNLKEVAHKYPDLLLFLSKFYPLAGDLRHGSEESWKNIPVEKWADKIKKIIHILLPDYEFPKSEKEKFIQTSKASQERIDAQVYTAQLLGWDVIRTMSDSLKRLVLSISPHYDNQPQKRLEPNDFVLTLSQIMEEAFFYELSNLTNVNPALPKNSAVSLIETKFGRKLNEGVASVTKTYYENALRQYRSTLNAMVLVYLAFSDSSKAGKIMQAGIDNLCSEIAMLRQHGNEFKIITQEKLAELRNSVFSLLKILY